MTGPVTGLPIDLPNVLQRAAPSAFQSESPSVRQSASPTAPLTVPATALSTGLETVRATALATGIPSGAMTVMWSASMIATAIVTATAWLNVLRIVPWTGRWTAFPSGVANGRSLEIATVPSALSIVVRSGWMTGDPSGFRIAVATGIAVANAPWIVPIVLLKDGIPGTTGIPGIRGVATVDRIVRRTGLSIGPSTVPWTGPSIVRLNGRAAVAAAVDIASRAEETKAVETAVVAGISGTIVTSVRRAAVVVVVVAGIARIRAVAAAVGITSSGTRTMEEAVAVAVRTSPGSSRRRPRSRWCRRSL